MMTQFKKQIMILFFTVLISTTYAEQWTWLYKKNFSAQELAHNKQKQLLLFSKVNVPHFCQLIFSWNALRPEKGYFSFYAQVRDARTQQWHEWHKMIDWGKDIQKSYLSKGTKTDYCHVRLEVPKKSLADGLRIKIISHDQADVSLLHALAVNISNITQFKLVPHITYHQLPSLSIPNIPQLSQMILDHPRAEHMCSPTSCSMLVSYLLKNSINPVHFAQHVYDHGLDSFGSWPFNTAHAYEHSKGTINFHVARLNSFADIYTKLKQSIPVVVSVRGPLEGAPREYKNGHLLLVVGWDQKTKKVICHDPAFTANEHVTTSYDIKSFCEAWARSHHLAYLAEFSS